MQRARLPHQERLEQAFGENLDGIAAYTGAGATLAMIGARAAATPETVHFGDHAPDLHTAAHEVAHVLQYRRASAPIPSGVGAIDSPAEADAGRAADAVVRGQSASVTAAPAGDVQMLPFSGLIRRIRGNKPPSALTDKHVDEHHKPQGGSLNRVDRIDYKRPIDAQGTTLGFFKPIIPPSAKPDWMPRTPDEQALETPDPYTHDAALHAIVATALDRILGFHLLPEERFGTHADPVTGEKMKGTVAPEVKGEPLLKHHFDQDMDMVDDMQRENVLSWFTQARTLARLVQDDTGAITGVKALSQTTFGNFAFADPTTQKGLWDLQLLDAITGEMDRHGGNIMIDRETGAVHGIDNDRNLMDDQLAARGKNRGLPALADAGTAARILKLPWKTVLSRLNSALKSAGLRSAGGKTKDGERAGPLGAELQERLRTRYLGVQAHLQSLGSNELVKVWNAQTYATAIADQRRENYTAVAVDQVQAGTVMVGRAQLEDQAGYDARMAAKAQKRLADEAAGADDQLDQSASPVVVPAQPVPAQAKAQGDLGWVAKLIAEKNAGEFRFGAKPLKVAA